MISEPIGVLGGTFDPIHYGHLQSAIEILETLSLAEIRFIPCKVPIHRNLPLFTAEQRLELIYLAIANQPGFIVDTRELNRTGLSYTVDTLISLRADIGWYTPICLIVGTDVFIEIYRWYRWQELLKLAHIVVMRRPGKMNIIPSNMTNFVEENLVNNYCYLKNQIAGSILFQTVTQLDISATQIRFMLTHGKTPRYLLPDSVLARIKSWNLLKNNDV